MELSVMGAATVLVAAPPSLHRQGLLATLHTHWPALACTVTPDAGQLLPLLRQQAYGLVVLDSTLSGPGLPQLLRQLRTIRGSQQLLVLTGRRLAPLLRRQLLQAGAHALLRQSAPPAAAVATIAVLLSGAGGGTVPGAATALAALPPTPFSPREVEVLRLVVADFSNQEIAEQLSLSVRTVESHRRALLQKAGARTLVGLAVQAVRQGWVTP
ncbi:response regulator transcription factor [Hymenobacter guriensis]|uniref:Response regulator transcription factor n=1 Tax=Hymenobacter guriensis TaxID=2793065 RepID=A0ABS0L2S1_9BACT|nr:response regulator transcription factor [Hymenobacter guriensis]MBG8554376.1 response regulator transcription factor [Hymenobacter guriensis]